MFSVSEISVPLPAWSKSRRFVIIRKKLRQEQSTQIQMDFDAFKYEYQAIVTNIDYMSATEIHAEYNLRCDVLPDEYKQVEVYTLRRIFLRVAANICGHGKYQYIRYSPDSRLEYIIKTIVRGLHSLPAILGV
ncbi:MAG: hypothetical protein ACYCYE_01205 [Clostridia bacterium]